MSQADDAFARRVVGALDRSLDEIDAPTRRKLAEARTQAMARMRESPLPVWRLAFAAGGGRHGSKHGRHGFRYVAAACMFALVLFGVGYWQNAGMTPASSDVAELDANLLADELPINAYLDKGFDSWLKRASR